MRSCPTPLLPINLQANATNPNFEEEGYKDKQAELAKLPMHAQVRLLEQKSGPY
jgi:hypothetical protein